MVEAKGLRQVGFLDVKGGGQVEVVGRTAYIGHVIGPEATTIVDVADPRHPEIIAELRCAHDNVHAHKVRVKNGLMLTNYESIEYTGKPGAGFKGGLHIYDVKDPAKPRPIGFWQTVGTGVHRFTFDGRYAYLSTTLEGYSQRIVLIMDLADPERPQEVGRWHWPGQWLAGGESPGIPHKDLTCHHPIRVGDRLYVSYWHAGWAILDIADMAHPKEVSRTEWTRRHAHPAHTCLKLPGRLKGLDVMLVVDEDVAKKREAGPAFVWVYDVTDETCPLVIGTFQLDHFESGMAERSHFGAHQPVEIVRSSEIPIAWFNQGLRLVDFANPHAPKETGFFKPDPQPGRKELLSNDVYEDDSGLIYLIDREQGLHIVERT